MSLSVFSRSLSRNTFKLTRASAISNNSIRCYSDAAPAKIETPETKIPVSPKIAGLVDQISTLTLLETADLIDALKVKLNISEITMPAVSAQGPAAAVPTAEAAQEEKPAEKTMFTVKLEKFDAASKAKIIREMKAILPGANLVEAKKFVESAPKVIRTDVPKEEAEKIKTTLEAVGATVALE